MRTYTTYAVLYALACGEDLLVCLYWWYSWVGARLLVKWEPGSESVNNSLARLVMDSNLCTKFQLCILPGFWDIYACLNWTTTTTTMTTRRIFKTDFLEWINYRLCDLSHFLHTRFFFDSTDRTDMSEAGSDWNLKLNVQISKCMGLMQDNLCQPYTLSATILSNVTLIAFFTFCKEWGDFS